MSDNQTSDFSFLEMNKKTNEIIEDLNENIDESNTKLHSV